MHSARRPEGKVLVKLLVALVLLGAGAFLLRPDDRALAHVAGAEDASWMALAAAVKAGAQGLPCAVIDLEALDANLALVKREQGPRALRIVRCGGEP